MTELVDVGYHDPWEQRDDVADAPPSREEYDPDVAAPAHARPRTRDELEQLLTFGSGIEQVLARQELERRAGAGYQPSLLGPAERLAQTRPRRST